MTDYDYLKERVICLTQLSLIGETEESLRIKVMENHRRVTLESALRDLAPAAKQFKAAIDAVVFMLDLATGGGLTALDRALNSLPESEITSIHSALNSVTSNGLLTELLFITHLSKLLAEKLSAPD